MNEIKINPNIRMPIIEETISFIDFCKNPVKSILILRSEIALFQGVNNHSDRYIKVIMDGINDDESVMDELLEKTIGGKDKVADLFTNFNVVYNQTSKELKYFGPLLLSPESSERLKNYLNNPGDKKRELEFLSSLGDMLESSEERIKGEVRTINQYVATVISDI